jgi:hypothetical protein
MIKLRDLIDRRWGYEQLAKQLEASGERQLSSNDSDRHEHSLCIWASWK